MPRFSASAGRILEEAFHQVEACGEGGGHEQDFEDEPQGTAADSGDVRKKVRQECAGVEGGRDSANQRGGQEKAGSGASLPTAACGSGHFSVLMNWSIVIAGSVMIWMVPLDPSATEIFAIVSLLGASTTFTKS